MGKFLSVIKVILMFFGALFLLEIIAVIYLVVADPLGIRNLVKPAAVGQGAASTGDKNPLLNQSQEAALQAIGIDPATLPTKITPAQEACMTNAVGAARAAEIKAGATPTLSDYLKAKNCL